MTETIEGTAVEVPPVATGAPAEGANALATMVYNRTPPANGAFASVNKLEDALVAMIVDKETPIERWMALEQWMVRNEARKAELAYNYARAQMIPHMPVIGKHGKASGVSKRTGATIEYDYMLSDELIEEVQTVLGRFGFFWEVEEKNDVAKKTCFCIGWLIHEDGHKSRPCEKTLPYDESGAKGEVQSCGSSASYARKYVLTGLAVVAVRGSDKDGKQFGNGHAQPKPRQQANTDQTSEAPGFTAPTKRITEEQRKTLVAKLDEAGYDKGTFVDTLQKKDPTVKDMSKVPADKYDEIIKWADGLIAKKKGLAQSNAARTFDPNPGAMAPKQSMIPPDSDEPHTFWERQVNAFIDELEAGKKTKAEAMAFNNDVCGPMEGVVPDEMWTRVGQRFGRVYGAMFQKDRRTAQR